VLVKILLQKKKGLIIRKDCKTIPSHVEYPQIESGKKLLLVFLKIGEWRKELRP